MDVHRHGWRKNEQWGACSVLRNLMSDDERRMNKKKTKATVLRDSFVDGMARKIVEKSNWFSRGVSRPLSRLLLWSRYHNIRLTSIQNVEICQSCYFFWDFSVDNYYRPIRISSLNDFNFFSPVNATGTLCNIGQRNRWILNYLSECF